MTVGAKPCGFRTYLGNRFAIPTSSTIPSGNTLTASICGVFTFRVSSGAGQRIAIDATTLEANAAMRSIVRRDTGESYEEFLRGLAKASGIATPTREELVRLDRERKKRMSDREWKSPADEDARIPKMKDGRTHLAHKAEYAVDLETGAVAAVPLPGADQGDTTNRFVVLCRL